jgi:hypothetical protein
MESREVYVAPKEVLEPDSSVSVSTTTTPVSKENEDILRQVPRSIEEVILGLKNFGIEENEEVLTFNSRNGKKVQLRITNMPTDEEIKALVSAEEYKGYAWVQRIRVEILSHSISWIDGMDIRALREKGVVVKDADGVNRDIQVVLRNVIMGWGQELVQTLWKIAMVHSEKIEKRYQSEFPDSTIMTEVERRFMDTVLKEIEDSSKEVIADSVKQLFEIEKEEGTE